MKVIRTISSSLIHDHPFVIINYFYRHHSRTLPKLLSNERIARVANDIFFCCVPRFSFKMYANLHAGCIFLIAFSLCHAQRTPAITYISDDQEVNIGSTVELACSVQYAQGIFPVQWVKSGKSSRDNFILTTDTALVVKDSRYGSLYDGASSTFTVMIKDVQDVDAGEYQCEVILSVTNKLVGVTHLTVLKPPVITDNSTQSVVAKQGDFVVMECYATGLPSPTVIWRRENNALLPTGKFKFKRSPS